MTKGEGFRNTAPTLAGIRKGGGKKGALDIEDLKGRSRKKKKKERKEKKGVLSSLTSEKKKKGIPQWLIIVRTSGILIETRRKRRRKGKEVFVLSTSWHLINGAAVVVQKFAYLDIRDAKERKGGKIRRKLS